MLTLPTSGFPNIRLGISSIDSNTVDVSVGGSPVGGRNFPRTDCELEFVHQRISSWWVQILFIFTPTWG